MESAADMEERRQELDLIYKALDRMRERDRTLIILFELEELSGLEIAELKGVKVATVWVWLHRARAEFRRQVAELGQTSFYLRELNR
jgi:RNA polymerase sigma-70 factor (ECF subfamily)